MQKHGCLLLEWKSLMEKFSKLVFWLMRDSNIVLRVKICGWRLPGWKRKTKPRIYCQKLWESSQRVKKSGLLPQENNQTWPWREEYWEKPLSITRTLLDYGNSSSSMRTKTKPNPFCIKLSNVCRRKSNSGWLSPGYKPTKKPRL